MPGCGDGSGDNSIEKFNLRNPHLICCITLYNESWPMLRSTLASCFEAIKHLVDNTNLQASFIVVVIIDGIETANPEVVSELGINSKHGQAIHYDSPDIWFQNVTTRMSEEFHIHELIRVGVVLKRRNKGKLDSHAIFFREFCERSDPDLFAQIDAGVVLDKASLFHMCDRMSESDRYVAVAAASTPDINQADVSSLNRWQILTFHDERFVSWHLEQMMNYLSVLPGQFHIVRWATINQSRKEPRGFFLGPSVNEIHPVSILKRYLNYEGEVGILSGNLRLAEDRILATELTFGSKGINRLLYEPLARAHVDLCDSWWELIKQRKRWTCGAFASGVRTLNIAINEAIAGQVKIYLPIVLYLALGLLMKLVSPSILMTLHVTLYRSAHVALSGFPILSDVYGYFSIVSLPILIFVSVITPFVQKNHATELLIFFSFTFLRWFVLLSIITLLLLGHDHLILLVVTNLLACWYCLARSGNFKFGCLPSFLSHRITSPWIGIPIISFSIIEFCSPAWGTKGINRPLTDSSLNKKLFGAGLVGTQFLISYLFLSHIISFSSCAFVWSLSLLLSLVLAATHNLFALGVGTLAEEVRHD